MNRIEEKNLVKADAYNEADTELCCWLYKWNQNLYQSFGRIHWERCKCRDIGIYANESSFLRKNIKNIPDRCIQFKYLWVLICLIQIWHIFQLALPDCL